MNQGLLPLVFFICLLPGPRPLALSLHLPICHSWRLCACSCYRWGEHRGFVSGCMCLTSRRLRWKMRQVAAIYQHLSGRWGGSAEQDAEDFSVWSWAWWNRCGFSSTASSMQHRASMHRKRREGRGSFLHPQAYTSKSSISFSPSAAPSLIPGSPSLRVCSATRPHALFLFLLVPTQFVSLLAWKQNADRIGEWTGGKNSFTLQRCHVDSLTFKPSLDESPTLRFRRLPQSACTHTHTNPLTSLTFSDLFPIYLLTHHFYSHFPDCDVQTDAQMLYRHMRYTLGLYYWPRLAPAAASGTLSTSLHWEDHLEGKRRTQEGGSSDKKHF